MSNAKPGIGGAPTRAITMPTDAATRKKFPVASGFMDYFPDAIAAVSNLSYIGNEQHNPGQPLNWARGKSTDEADTMLRHFLQRGTLDTDGIRHSVKMAWRSMALLQKELEAEEEYTKAALNVDAKLPTVRTIPVQGSPKDSAEVPVRLEVGQLLGGRIMPKEKALAELKKDYERFADDIRTSRFESSPEEPTRPRVPNGF